MASVGMPTKSQVLHFLSTLLVILSGFMALADKWTPTPFLPPDFAQYWPLVLVTASFLTRLVHLFGDWLDNFELDDSFKSLLITGILIAGLTCGGLCFISGCTALSGASISLDGKYGQIRYSLPAATPSGFSK